jgi:hypothetical protein
MMNYLTTLPNEVVIKHETLKIKKEKKEKKENKYMDSELVLKKEKNYNKMDRTIPILSECKLKNVDVTPPTYGKFCKALETLPPYNFTGNFLVTPSNAGTSESFVETPIKCKVQEGNFEISIKSEVLKGFVQTPATCEILEKTMEKTVECETLTDGVVTLTGYETLENFVETPAICEILENTSEKPLECEASTDGDVTRPGCGIVENFVETVTKSELLQETSIQSVPCETLTDDITSSGKCGVMTHAIDISTNKIILKNIVLRTIILRKAIQAWKELRSYYAPVQIPSPFTHPPKYRNLDCIGVLGYGGFGSVTLEKDITTGNTFALKMISKGSILQSRAQKEETVVREKEVLLMLDHPFIIKLYTTYQTKNYVSFLLEKALGGELAQVIHTNKWNSKCAKYYSACVILAFRHMHERNIIYRDLKPENLLLDDHGFLKVTDLGFAKYELGKAMTAVGTIEYCAPEMVDGKGHNRALDWYTVGILIFEFMTGDTPFYGNDDFTMFQKIRKGIEAVTFPRSLSKNCKSLIIGLCQLKPEERIPMKKNGIQILQNMPWFETIHWKDVEALKVKPPLEVFVKSAEDCTNYAPQEKDKPEYMEHDGVQERWNKFAPMER